MENPWGKIILGGLAAAATWNSLGAERQRKAIDILEVTLVTVEQVAIALGQQRQQLALPPVPELEPESAPMPLPPQWLEEALRKHFPDYQPSAVGTPSVVAALPEVETGARWREVIIPPAVVLVLGKRDGGKSVLAYRLLELFRFRLSPYVVGASATARQLLPDWIDIAPTLEELPNKTIAIIDEAYLSYHVRESMAQESKAMSQALTLDVGPVNAYFLVVGASPDDCLALTRLWLSDELPKNSESRVLGVVLRSLRRHTQVKFLVSYADPSQVHLGTIYQATGWVYAGLSEATPLYDLGDGKARHS